jgi:hypothetical protein
VQPPNLDKDQVAKLFRIFGRHARCSQRVDFFGRGLQAAADNLTDGIDECVAVLETK